MAVLPIFAPTGVAGIEGSIPGIVEAIASQAGGSGLCFLDRTPTRFGGDPPVGLCRRLHERTIFFDNVGGDILDAALARLAMRGRVVLCGGIANYNAIEPPPGPKNYLNLIVQRGRMEGFIVTDYMPRAAEAIGALAGWVQAGKLKNKVDVQHGLENAPATLRRLFEGRNEGKQLLRVAE